MIPKTIKTPLVEAVHVSIDSIKYFAVFIAALTLPMALLGADLIDRFTVLVLTPTLLLVVGSYGKSVLLQLRSRPITNLSPVLSSDAVPTS